eukprot:1164013-Amphidinium_carterae.2
MSSRAPLWCTHMSLSSTQISTYFSFRQNSPSGTSLSLSTAASLAGFNKPDYALGDWGLSF